MQLELAKGHVDSGGERIYWEFATAGDGDDRPVVVLAHGAGGTHAVWFQQVPALGQRFRVLTWDSRGFGNSTNTTDSPTTEAAAGDLAAVLDSLSINEAHLVGQSMGGWHVACFAGTNPRRVLSLTLADTVGGLWTDELRSAFAAFASTGSLASPGPDVVGRHPAIWSGTGERDPALAFLYQALGSFHEPPMGQVVRALQWTIGHERISELDVPVLFIAGEHDDLFPAALLADSARRIPGAEFVEIPNAGHSPYFEQPTAWNAALLSFLTS